jgi:hypothetical protein
MLNAYEVDSSSIDDIQVGVHEDVVVAVIR